MIADWHPYDDATRTRWSWDRVWIGCGKQKQPGCAPAGELYTGPVFAAHKAIVEHLGLLARHGGFEVLSALYGVVPCETVIEPYEATLDDAEQRRRFSELVFAEVLALVDEIDASRRKLGDPDANTWGRVGPAFGPPLQPSILVLAGAPYVDGWAGRARALGVQVDDPLRGYQLGERRQFADQFRRLYPAWPPEGDPEGTGATRREQLLDAVDCFDFERGEEATALPATPTSTSTFALTSPTAAPPRSRARRAAAQPQIGGHHG